MSSVAGGPSAIAWRKRETEPLGERLDPAVMETSPAAKPCRCLSQKSTPVMLKIFQGEDCGC